MMSTLSIYQAAISPLGGWVSIFYQCLKLGLIWQPLGYQSCAVPIELLGLLKLYIVYDVNKRQVNKCSLIYSIEQFIKR